MQLSAKYARISDEITLPYVERGDPEGTPVIFLHGITDSHHSFDLICDHLPPGIRAIAVTQRGHGDASRPASGYRPRDMADDLGAFMDLLGIRSAVIVGHSMGSYVAQRFAIDHPERVSKLVLIGSFASSSRKSEIREFVANEIRPLDDPISREFVEEFQSSTIANPVDPKFFETAVDESLKLPASVWREAFESLLEADHSDELRTIKVPTLVIWGESDAYFDRADQEQLLEKIEGAVLSIYAGVGHAPHWEVPEKAASEIAGFATRKLERAAVLSTP